MPYTLVHPGFSIWLKRRWFKKLSYTGLIFGSITPDFDILFRFTESRFHIIGFNFFDIFFILLPITLFISLIFHFYTRNTLIDHLPHIFQSKFQKYKSFDYMAFLKNNFIIEVFSILIGISIHQLMDFLSHWDAYNFMSFMYDYIYTNSMLIDFYYYIGWYFPQIAATALGLYFILKLILEPTLSIKNILSSIIHLSSHKIFFWVCFILISISFGLIKYLFFNYNEDGLEWHVLIIFFTSGLLFSFYVTPLLFKSLSKIKYYKYQ